MSSRVIEVRTVLQVPRDSKGRSATTFCTFRYDPADPLAVQMVFPDDDGGPVVWEFARDLLIDGMEGPVGDAKVRVWPNSGPTVSVRLSTPPLGEAVMVIPADLLGHFLAKTLVTVPRGREVEVTEPAVDEFLARLLLGGTR